MAPATPNRKTVLITGCSPGGIGYALAQSFHRRSYTVYATARDPASLTALRTLGVTPLSLEVTSSTSIASAVEQVATQTNGRLDILINNAGQNYTVPALDISVDEANAIFATNTIAVMALCQAFAPLVIAAQGTIVNIGSVAAKLPFVFGSVYGASKAAVHSYSETLRVELAPFGVDVVVVVAGGVKSRIARMERRLRPGSRYAGLEREYEERVVFSQRAGIEAERFAEEVVGDLEGEGWALGLWGKGKRREIWRGGEAGLIWVLLGVLPKWGLDLWFSWMFGLRRLKRMLEGEKKKV